MSIEQKYSAELTHQEMIDTISEHWKEEALAYKAAGQELRSSLDSEQRTKAYGERVNRLSRCDALLDAYVELQKC